MALRAGLVASQRLWFTSVNGYGSCEREKRVGRNDATYGRGLMNEAVKIGSYEVEKRMDVTLFVYRFYSEF